MKDPEVDNWQARLKGRAVRVLQAFLDYEKDAAHQDYFRHQLPPKNDLDPDPPSQFNRLRHRMLTLLGDSALPSHYLRGYLATEQYAGGRWAPGARGVLTALIEDLSDGHLPEVGWTVRAETYDEMLVVAEQLLDQRAAIPAAVVAGAALEAYLRRLCQSRGLEVETGRKGGSLGKYAAALKEAGTIERGLFRSLKGWIELRNDAVHMRADGVDATTVRSMIRGVGDLMSLLPAST